jgi:tRNA-dihydrouridine synthase 3
MLIASSLAGCPLDIICAKGAGASLMLRPNNIKGILQGVTGALNCPVTIKMRTGWNEEKPFAHELVHKIQSWGIDGIGSVMVSMAICACGHCVLVFRL